MLRIVTSIEDAQALVDFGKRAAEHFIEHPEHSSFGDLEPETYLALRWGLHDRAILVLKLDPDFHPFVYGDCIRPLGGSDAF